MSFCSSGFGLALLLALTPLSVAAQQADTTTGVGSGVHDVAKSPARAAVYSLGGTVLPMAGGLALMTVGERSMSWGRIEVGTDLSQVGALLVVGGLVAGPAAGHIYADHRRQARLGLGIRSGAAVVGIGAATVLLLDTSLDFLGPEESRLSRTGRIAEGVLTGAIVALMGSAVVDILTAPFLAHHQNGESTHRVRIDPRVSPDLDQAGMVMRLRF